MHNEILNYCREDMLSMLDFISGFGPEAFFKLISKVDPDYAFIYLWDILVTHNYWKSQAKFLKRTHWKGDRSLP